MKLHEHQAKAVFRARGIPVPDGEVAATPDEAVACAERVGLPVAVKAQVLVGGRGKAGGVKLARTPAEVRERASEILGLTIKGLPVRKVLVERTADIERELYLAIVLDRAHRSPALLASALGGVDIEEVARTQPSAIEHVPIDPVVGLRPHVLWPALRRVLGGPELVPAGIAFAKELYGVFVREDASLVEVNPLVVSKDQRLIALDGKILLDDNAEFRHPEWDALRDPEADDPRELEAREHDLSFVALSGDIGCIVNGAGLAMATMDMVKLAGGEPANFLDVGGSSRPEKVFHAMRIILEDPDVRVILLNIFGGITRCDDIARGLLEAKAKLAVRTPVVARLTGTNEAEARELLAGSDFVAAASMDEAVQTAVWLVSSGEVA